MAIGQSFNLVTPLQVAVFTSCIANGGRVLVPTVVRRVETTDGQLIRGLEVTVKRKVWIKPEHLGLIVQALSQAVTDPSGTGQKAKVEGLTVAGKTGTVQVIELEDPKRRKKAEEMPYVHRDHAWFTCFAPVENPRVVISVIMEHSGHGGSVAAPVAASILEAWRNLQNEPNTSALAAGLGESEHP